TSYGQALVVKIALLAAAMLLAAVNLARTKPRLQASRSRPDLAAGAAVLLRRLIAGETFFLWGAVFAAGVLSSLAPPSKALAMVGHWGVTFEVTPRGGTPFQVLLVDRASG